MKVAPPAVQVDEIPLRRRFAHTPQLRHSAASRAPTRRAGDIRCRWAPATSPGSAEHGQAARLPPIRRSCQSVAPTWAANGLHERMVDTERLAATSTFRSTRLKKFSVTAFAAVPHHQSMRCADTSQGRRTGRHAAFQARKPPAMSVAMWIPSCWRVAAARLEEYPSLHTTTTWRSCEAQGSRASQAGSSRHSNTVRSITTAPGRAPSASRHACGRMSTSTAPTCCAR